MIIEITNSEKMKELGYAIGSLLTGGEIIELIGDVGAGKTTLIKGIAAGLGIEGDIQSPSFTISRVYGGRDDITFIHYDFYRLATSGIMANEITDVIGAPKTVIAIEWSNAVNDVLPKDRLSIKIEANTEESRLVSFTSGGVISKRIEESALYDFNSKH